MKDCLRWWQTLQVTFRINLSQVLVLEMTCTAFTVENDWNLRDNANLNGIWPPRTVLLATKGQALQYIYSHSQTFIKLVSVEMKNQYIRKMFCSLFKNSARTTLNYNNIGYSYTNKNIVLYIFLDKNNMIMDLK